MNYAQRIVLILFGLSIAAGAIWGDPLYFRLSYFWGALLIGSWLMSYLSLRGIEVHRSARTLRSQVGQIFEERYEIQNTGRLPRLLIEVRDKSNLPGSRGSHVLSLIGSRESRYYLSRTRLVQRGVYALGPTELVAGDIFGFFVSQKTFQSRDSLLVYPLMVDVESFPNPPGILPGGEALRRRTTQITSNAAGVREYQPGDPLNRIHWLSTARRDRLMVKEFELDPLADVWLFVDASRSVQIEKPSISSTGFQVEDLWWRKTQYTLPPSTLEYAIAIAASLARYYLHRGRAVGLAYSAHSLRILPSDRGARQLGKILEELAMLQMGNDLPLQGLVEAQARHLPRGSAAVMITPSTSDTIFQTADLLLRRGFHPVAVLIDPLSFGGKENQDKLAITLRSLRVPICQVVYNQDLTKALSAVTSSSNY